MNARAMALWGMVTLVCLVAPIAMEAAEGVDLGERYPATLDTSREGLAWVCEKSDVWRLSEFTYSAGNEFQLQLKSATLVLGRHETNVLWATVIPDQDGELSKSSAGQGEHVTSVWMRFHPSRLSELFPKATVQGPGDEASLADAKRLATHKIISSWQSGGKPTVPEKPMLVFDLETREGSRRFFSISTAKGTVDYVDAFRQRGLPVARAVDQDMALKIFDTVWNAFDREYAMFVVKPGVDWVKLGDRYRAQLPSATDNFKLAEIIRSLIAHLQDLHVSLRVDGTDILVYNRERPLNANRKALPKLVGPMTSTDSHLVWSITPDNIGYIAIDRLVDPQLPKVFGETLAKMEPTRGLILDLRYNGGGSEPLGLEIAGSFLDQPRVYAKSQYRNGPGHSDLTEPKERVCRPTDPWYYVGPVIVLQGQKTMSSAESFAQMLAQAPQVTTMGDRTAGSSGNPRFLDAGEGITVGLPRWNDLTADGKPVDFVGIPPDVTINATPADFREVADPVLTAALERLRSIDKFEGKSLIVRPGSHRPAQRPRVVSVSPGRGATGIPSETEIRIRFDQPMDPDSFGLQWKAKNPNQSDKVGFRLRDKIRYDDATNEFIVPVTLTPNSLHQIDLITVDRSHPKVAYQFFQSKEGVIASGDSWEFRTAKADKDERAKTGAKASSDSSVLPANEQGEAALRRLVSAIRDRRRKLKSVIVRADDREQWTDRNVWFQRLSPHHWAQYWSQGKHRFRTDASAFFHPKTTMQIGGDEQRCWSRIGDAFTAGPTESFAVKKVSIVDPLMAESGRDDDDVIATLDLEYAGTRQFKGQACHCLRSSRTAKAEADAKSPRIHEWLFDAKTLLPVLYEDSGEFAQRYEISYISIDEELPAETFHPPVDKGVNPAELEPLGEGFDHRFIHVIDPTSGGINVRWGKRGKAGTNSSGVSG